MTSEKITAIKSLGRIFKTVNICNIFCILLYSQFIHFIDYIIAVSFDFEKLSSKIINLHFFFLSGLMAH